MNDTSQYQRFDWMVQYIRSWRQYDMYIEFHFPPGSIKDIDSISALVGRNCIANIDNSRATSLYFNFRNQMLFDYLMEKKERQPYTISFQFAPDMLESLGADENELFTECIKGIDEAMLRAALTLAIERESYEHAGMIRDEITYRTKNAKL